MPKKLVDLPQKFKSLHKTKKLDPKQTKGLVALLNDLDKYKPANYQELIMETLSGEFSDFGNEKYDAPLIFLMDIVKEIKPMREGIINGKYDHPYVILEGETTGSKDKKVEAELRGEFGDNVFDILMGK